MLHKRLAVLDLGTNTFNLLIAEPKEEGFEILHKEKIGVKIGKNGLSKGLIDEEARERLLDALQHFSGVLSRYRIPDEKIWAIATSAFRNAKNAQKILLEIRQRTGIQVKIISGDEEAEYIYLGIRAAYILGEQASLLMDIGGGSIEFIICNKYKIFWKKSYELGGQRLYDQFMKKDPIVELDIQKMDIYLESQLLELSNAVFMYNPKALIGSAGTFETLAEIAYKRRFKEKISDLLNEKGELAGISFTFSADEFHYLYQDIVRNDRATRLNIPGMIEMRVDMIVVACCLLKFVVDRYEYDNIGVSTYSLKEGYLISKLETP